MYIDPSKEVRMKNRKSNSAPTALRLLKLLWIFIPLVLAAAMYFLLPLFPEFTEHVISRGLFKVFTGRFAPHLAGI